MSTSDVSPSEMKRLTDISDNELAAMRAGVVPVGEVDAAVATFVRDLGSAFPERSTERLEAGHVAAMLEAAHLATDKGESALQPTSKAHGPAGRVSGLPKSWRERVAMKIRIALATRMAKIALVAIAMVLAFSGVALAGMLPASVQDAVADTVKAVGLDLPGGTDEVDEGTEAEDIDFDDQDDMDVEDQDDVDGDDADEDDGEESDDDDGDDVDDAEDADDSDDADDDSEDADDDDDDESDDDEGDDSDDDSSDSDSDDSDDESDD